MDNQTDISLLKRELEYYKSQLDIYSGEAIRSQYNLAQMANQLTQLRNGYSIIAQIQQAFNKESSIVHLYENMFELILQRLHMDRIVVLKNIVDNKFKPWIGKGFHEELETVDTVLLPAELCKDKSTLLINGQKNPDESSAALRNLLKCPFVVACAYEADHVLHVMAIGRYHERKPMSYAAFTEIDVFVLASLAGIINGINQHITRQNELQSERMRIARDMHDDLGSELSKIAIYIEILRSQKSLDEDVLKFTEKIKTSTHEVIENLGNIVWALNPENNNMQNLVAYLREFCTEYLELHGLSLTMISENIQDQMVRSIVRKNVLMVTKEVLRNCVKHAHATGVHMEIKVTHTHFMFSIADDGTGITHLRQFGNGINNMRQRMADIEGTIHMSQNVPSGTVISMNIPLT